MDSCASSILGTNTYSQSTQFRVLIINSERLLFVIYKNVNMQLSTQSGSYGNNRVTKLADYGIIKINGFNINFKNLGIRKRR